MGAAASACAMERAGEEGVGGGPATCYSAPRARLVLLDYSHLAPGALCTRQHSAADYAEHRQAAGCPCVHGPAVSAWRPRHGAVL